MQRVARWAPLAGRAGAVIIVVALIVAWPRGSLVGPSASATPAAGTDVQCLQDGVDTQITISDETGLIRSCEAIRIDRLPTPASAEQGPTRTLVLTLAGSPCDIEAPLRFIREASRYALRSSWTGGVCVLSEMEAAIRLDLRAPVDRASVSVLLGGAAATPLPTTNFDCGGQITVIDHSGHVASYADQGSVMRLSQDPNASNPNGDLDTVHVWWGRSQLIVSTTIDVYQTSDGAYYVLVGDQAAANSPFMPDAHAVDLTLSAPAPDSTVTLRTYSRADASPYPSTSPSPGAAAGAYLCGSAMSLSDSTGAVVGCADKGEPDYHTTHQGVVADPIDPRLLHLAWGQSYCVSSQRLSVTNSTSGASTSYEVTIVPTSFDPSCSDGPNAHAADIEFTEPVDPSNVSLNVISGIVECTNAGDLGRHVGQVAIRDGTGLITGCTQNPAQARDGSPDATANLKPNEVRVNWTDESGPAEIPLTLSAATGHFELTSPDSCSSCETTDFEIEVDFATPVDASAMWTGLDGRTTQPPPTPTATPTAAGLDCFPDLDPLGSGTAGHPKLYDGSGLVTACEAARPRSLVTGVSNPDGYINQLLVDWVGACNPEYTLRLVPHDKRFELAITPGDCQLSPAVGHAVTLTLSSPIDATEVDLVFLRPSADTPLPPE